MHDESAAPGGEAASAANEFQPTQPRASDGAQRLAIEFTGSGSEYFRIWLVNLLLTIVTLGFYHPFAKARRLSYFHSNTVVGGEALGFHGNPWKMLRGYLLMLLFGIAYGVSSRFSPPAAMAAAAAFVLLWPALWRASLQFRLGNTSWRGLRFGFSGGLGGAYLAMLPAFAPWVGFIAFAWLMPQPGAEAVEPPTVDPRVVWLLGLSLLGGMALMPLSLAWVKRYQHGHYVYAGQRSRLEAGTGEFYFYALKLFGVGLLAGMASAIFMGVGFAATAVIGRKDLGFAVGMAAVVAGYAFYFVVLLPFAQSRLQNLVWGHTRSEALQCRSALRLLPLGWLTLKNLMLTVLTLGLYWPFAAVATARMKLQAVALDAEGDIEHWSAGADRSTQDATGDAAGDFFGIDLGL
ncbi:MAG TPA: YjgN family protein [Ideonella sp.]|nr:YjgN family protein [Ideonella sp.]